MNRKFLKRNLNLIFKQKKFLLISFTIFLMGVYVISKFNDNTNSYDEIDQAFTSKTIQACLNKVKAENKHSVWTLLTDDNNYAFSAIKLLKSILTNTKTAKFDTIVMELNEKPLEEEIKLKLEEAGWKICRVNRIAPRANTQTFERFIDQFSKFNLWKMTEYKSIFYFDSDAFVVGNIDQLLNVYKKLEELDLKIACTRDIMAGKWQSGFNLGVFSIIPNRTEYERLLYFKDDESFEFQTDMAEQGFLNVLYKNQWYDFGFENNANLAAYSQLRNFWRNRERDINVIHYTMNKPWACTSEYKEICDLWFYFN